MTALSKSATSAAERAPDAGPRGFPGIPGAAADGVAVWHVVEEPPAPGDVTRPVRHRVRLVRADGGVRGNDASALLVRRGSVLSGTTSPGRLAWADGSPMPIEIEVVHAVGATARVAVRFR